MRWQRLLFAGLTALLCAGPVGRAAAGDRFYYLGYEIIQVIDGDTDAIVADIPIAGASREVAFSADRKFLYVATNRHLVHTVDLAQSRVVATIDLSNDGWDRVMFGFVLDPDGRTAYGGFMSRRTAGGEVVIGGPVVAQFELETGKLLRSVEVPWGVAHIVSVRGGTTLYAFGQDLYKIDTTGHDLKITETAPMFDRKMNILPFWDYAFDNGGIASMNYYTPEFMGVMLVDQKTGEISEIPLQGDPVMAYSVVLSPDRKRAYAIMDELTVIDLVGKTYVESTPIAEGTCYAVNVSGDGKKIYAGGGGSTLTVYDSKTLKALKVLQMASDGMDIRRVSF
jgi:DNA-binding beta-propeller fold protein YncE